MKKITRYLVIAIVLAILFSACGKKEEAPKEKTYHTDEFCGCTYSVPDSWGLTKTEAKVNYQIGDNGLVEMNFIQREISDTQWEEGAKEIINGLDQTEEISIKEYAPLESAKAPTYSVKGDLISGGKTYQYDGYVVNVDNRVILLIQKAIAGDSQESDEDLKNILETFDSSGLSAYFGLSSSYAAETNSEPVEFEVAINVIGKWEDSKVIFEVDTNLPDEAELMFSLSNGDYNTGSNFSAEDKGIVSGGHVTTNGFSASGKPLSGDYDLCVSMSLPSRQSDNVRLKIGEKGEYMTGPLVEASDIFEANTVSALFSVSVNDEITVAPESDYSFTKFRTEEEEEEETLE